MLRKLDNKNMGRSDLGCLKSIFHFSFAEYYNPDKRKENLEISQNMQMYYQNKSLIQPY